MSTDALRVRLPRGIPWLDGRCRELPHALGPDVALCYVNLPEDAGQAIRLVGSTMRERAERIANPQDRGLFLAAHAVLRSVLAESLGEAPCGVELVVDELGKPRLAGHSMRFSMSRSGASLLIGIGAERDIGVDIECLCELPDLDFLAHSQLSPIEHRLWLRGGYRSPVEDFLQLWTRKEACVKAAGIGLAIPLAQVEVGGSSAAPVEVDFRFACDSWRARVVSLAMPPGVCGAVAVIDHHSRVAGAA